MKKIILFIACNSSQNDSNRTIEEHNSSRLIQKEPLYQEQWALHYDKPFYKAYEINKEAHIHVKETLRRYSGKGVKVMKNLKELLPLLLLLLPVSLFLEKNPNLTHQEVQEILKKSSDKIGTLEYINEHNDYYGYGKINLDKALFLISSK